MSDLKESIELLFDTVRELDGFLVSRNLSLLREKDIDDVFEKAQSVERIWNEISRRGLNSVLTGKMSEYLELITTGVEDRSLEKISEEILEKFLCQNLPQSVITSAVRSYVHIFGSERFQRIVQDIGSSRLGFLEASKIASELFTSVEIESIFILESWAKQRRAGGEDEVEKKIEGLLADNEVNLLFKILSVQTVDSSRTQDFVYETLLRKPFPLQCWSSLGECKPVLQGALSHRPELLQYFLPQISDSALKLKLNVDELKWENKEGCMTFVDVVAALKVFLSLPGTKRATLDFIRGNKESICGNVWKLIERECLTDSASLALH